MLYLNRYFRWKLCLALVMFMMGQNSRAQDIQSREVSLVGDVVKIRYYGPPGFEGTRGSNSQVTAIALRLRNPISVSVYSDDGSLILRKVDILQIIDPRPYIFKGLCGSKLHIEAILVNPDTADSGTAAMIEVRNYKVLFSSTCKNVGFGGLRGFR